ncbi:hypothetical protein FRACYDRAFT_251499 [Fragilariopsis cylindrus CCMP1102]|uniref:Uncharacterized protein n=1 Tax=Fragilariopsis cylindrus CCMP1102 TaxID=635003 RepID=A0A1E7EMR0_9STRA|nr:hypothetical protein FRACYDRAFT_251499 [Fragilariopsis cylindrus CCMP1102]|eukprot:OEU07191.1 hypothetical protein FRACYDRAFT_251499 [Fragilariopsis cylindrus CCMP1102]
MSTTMMMMKKSIVAVIVGLQLLAAMMTITTTTNVFVSSFSPPSQQRVVRQQLSQESRQSESRSWRNIKLSASENDDEPEPESQGLIFGDAIESEMNAVKGANEYDFGQIDYLALAKQRAANKPESNNNVAGDDEWMDLAKEKEEQFGKIDDWENSQKEAGNADSQSLLMFNTEQPTDVDGGSEDSDDDEPKLLLL